TVQPFNGLTDTLNIFGLRVAASLPPNLQPGDLLTVAVQGFKGDQVLVQVMSRTPAATSSASTPTATSDVQTVTSQPAPATPVVGDTFEHTPLPIPVLAEEPEFPPLPPPPAPPQSSGTPQQAPPPTIEEEAQAPSTRTTLPAAPRIVPQTPGAVNAETLSVEARLALNRAATPPPNLRAPVPPPPAAPRAATPGATTVPPPRPNVATPPPAAPRTPFAPIITMRPDAAKPAPQPLPGSPAQARPTTTVVPAQTRIAVPTAEELLSDTTQLLRALRIPVTPTTQTFAKLVIAQPEQVATALQALEESLPNSDDPRITTLRTLAGFVGNLDPQSPTFTTQVTSYISHVVEGPEQKLLGLVQGQAAPLPDVETPPPVPVQPQAQATAQSQAQTQTPASQAPQPAAVTEDPTTAAARIAARVAASDADLKTQLISVLSRAQPENALGETGTVVARNALTALVASQLSTLASQQSQPPSWTFTVPVTVDQQTYPAQVQVQRDKPEGKGEQLTGDDFHIAFILDTKRFGTIGIDLHAVQRSVSVTVRTERPSAATTFKSALASLGNRLESMKYNVKGLDAHTTRTKPTFESQEPPPSDTINVVNKKV
ncbi:MAG: hypothetical protein JO349_08205, partial [Candidatus Eremiobacteraeota bacterium]|nr:hypothetical protein [Candidatus Eremiobacteraeota bacterium]